MALALVLLAGFGMRAMATLVPDCIAGDDGAYSYVQIRGILRQGHLPVPDFPLLFYVLAAIAKLLSAVMDLNEAIVAVVRWTDTLLPLALAFPVYGFARDFTREQPSRGALAIILAGLMSVASGHALIMAAGMIKNEAALPFSFLYMYFLHRSLQKGKGRHLWLAALCFLVASLTHISALVLNAVFTLMAALLGGLSQRRA